jgi:hypothetical protein
VLPPESEGECIKILRIEDGGLLELLNAFLETVKGFVIPAGSVVVIFSAAHLAMIGTEAYAAEFAEAKYRLSRLMGNGIELLHGFPILLNGTGNKALIKGILDLEHWMGIVSTGRDVSGTRKHCIKLTLGNTLGSFSAGGGTGSPHAPDAAKQVGSPMASALYPMRYMLPTLKTAEKMICESPWYYDVPDVIEPVTETDERNIIEQLVQELNSLYMADLALEISVDREFVEDGTEQQDMLHGKRIVVIGASHGARIALALEDLGAIVVDLSCPGWRVTTSNVAAMCHQLSSVLAEDFDGETLIVYQLFDNNFYMACDDEGVRSLPTKGSDNHYHVRGRLVTADRDEVRRLFTEVLPLLRAGQACSKFLLTPLMRYVGGGCCSDTTHIINRGERQYSATIAEKLGEMKGSLGSLAFTRRLRNFVVICPNELLKQEDTAATAAMLHRYWADDHVHMAAEGYQVLGKRLIERMLEADLKRPTLSSNTGPSAPIDWTTQRSN